MNRSILLLIALAVAVILIMQRLYIIQAGTLLGSRIDHEPVLKAMAESFEIKH